MTSIRKKQLLLGFLLLVLSFIGITFFTSRRGRTEKGFSDLPRVVPAHIETVHRQPIAKTEEEPGTIVAIQHADIAAKIMSRIAEVYVREGDHVRQGQLLARLEGRDLAVGVQQANAAIESANAQLAKAKQGPRPEQIAQADAAVRRAKAAVEQAAANLDLVKTGARSQQKLQADQAVLVAKQQIAQANAMLATANANLGSAQADYDRMATLYAQDIIPKQRLEHTATQLEAAKQAVHQAEAAVNQANEGLEIAKASASQVYEGARTQEITAAEKQVEQAQAGYQQAQQEAVMAHQGGRWEDIAQASAGIAQARAGLAGAQTMSGYTAIYAPFNGVITGRKADPGSMAMPQFPMLTMDDDSLYQLASQVPEQLAAHLSPGERVMVRLDALNTTLSATVAEMVPGADASSHTVTVKVNLPHVAGLLSGLFGRLLITSGCEQALTIPYSALIDRHGLNGVYVLDEHDIAQFTLVTPGARLADRVEVLSGLQDGQRVIISNVDRITAGQRIRAEGGAL